MFHRTPRAVPVSGPERTGDRALGLISGIVIGVASTAPGYSGWINGWVIVAAGDGPGTYRPAGRAMGIVSILFYALLTAIDSYAKDFGETAPLGIGGVFVLGIGSILIGVVLMVIWNIMAPAFFRGETMRRKVSIGEQGQAISTESID
jgi:hypothetical protein